MAVSADPDGQRWYELEKELVLTLPGLFPSSPEYWLILDPELLRVAVVLLWTT